MNTFELTAQWAESLGLSYSMADSVTSTNDVAKDEALQLKEDFKLYLSKHQTAGRGRFDRTWEDDGQGGFFLSSWSYRVAQSPSPMITPRIGLVVIEAFAQSFPEGKWALKAPNDILLNGLKVAGILTEVVSQANHHRLIVGVGVNVTHAPKGLKTATSLMDHLPKFNLKKWSTFLEALKKGMDETQRMGHISALQPDECSKLLDWLNENPNLNEQYCEVSEDGKLAYDGQVLNWMEL